MESQSIGAVGAPMSGAMPASPPAPVAATGPAKAASPQATRHGAEADPAVEAPRAEAEVPQRDPRSLQYQVDGHRVITTIVDENNKTVVVQIPDAEMIRIAKSIDRMQGFLVEEKA